MDIQLLIVILFFIAALFFIGKKLFSKVRHEANNDCAGCASDTVKAKDAKK